MPILDDNEFRTDHDIDFEHPMMLGNDYSNKEQGVYIYSANKDAINARIENKVYPHRINVEFSQRDSGGNAQLADMYFHPEDLERLGVLLQYEARKYMQLRDEAIAAKLASEQEQNKQQHLSNKGRGF